MYGLQPDGTELGVEALAHLKADELELAVELRAWQNHLASGGPEPTELGRRAAAFQRMAHEVAFTVLNRLAAIRMAEERGHVIESVRNGPASDGFRLFEQLAAGALGDRDETYATYLGLLFDELDTELGVLFERRSPGGRVFPRPLALSAVLDSLNTGAITRLWTEDETIGWIYQYFNSKEERDAMRKASPAPRNSRELAVRNQFFTPRYVVEFLTDNTLGRLWYEMRYGATRLAEECRYLIRRQNEIFLGVGEAEPLDDEPSPDASQAELLHVAVYVPHRPKKDPRELAILDPAAGSGHFLLYAFDLLETIYEEAWSDPNPARCNLTGQTLSEDYPDLAILRQALPGLILRHNLHGIDIDPRARQIAVLALWLRSQRSFQRLGMPPADRPAIRRSNIVTAEPMPGERGLLDDFVASLRPSVLGDLVRVVWDKMRLAGEAGSLLKIEQDLRTAIESAKGQWLKASESDQLALFGDIDRHPQQVLPFDVSGISDVQFWNEAEERVLDALRAYSETVSNRTGTSRRLFAEDAIEGFAFIDLARRTYDVILMNPPFGQSSPDLYLYLKAQYPEAFIDLLAAFVDRASGLASGGRVGSIVSRSCLYTKTLTDWRLKNVIPALTILADLGEGVLDNAVVRSCAFILDRTPRRRLGAFSDVRRRENKEADLEADVVALNRSERREGVTLIEPSQFEQLPQARIAYDLPREFWRLATDYPPFEPDHGSVRMGMTTYDDERFLRLLWEVDSSRIGIGKTWVPLAKGGYFETFYQDIHLAIQWEHDGREVGEHNRLLYATDAQSRRASRWYLKPALTYVRRTTSGFCARLLPANCYFGEKGPAILPEPQVDVLYLLGLFNSSVVRALVHAQAAGGSFETGIVKKVPWFEPSPDVVTSVRSLAVEAWAAKASIYSEIETDPDFQPFRFTASPTLDAVAEGIRLGIAAANQTVTENVRRIDALVNSSLGLPSDLDLELFDVALGDHKIQVTPDDPVSVSHGLLSWAVGVTVGRWDVRAMSDRSPQRAPSAAGDALPPLPPGSLRASASQAVAPRGISTDSSGDAVYPVSVNWDGILVDEPGLQGNPHAQDIVERVREVIALLWPSKDGSAAQTIEAEACAMVAERSLREYFRRPSGFFADHLVRYSKSRRQAPIYWPLSTTSGSYTLWIYSQRLSDDLLYRAVTGYVEPHLVRVEGQIAEFETELSRSTVRDASRLRDRLGEMRAFRAELNEFRAELLRVAALPYRPNLDDGVLISAAPLHQLFRFPKWRKDLKACWDRLEAGEFDWAHLAFAIWPDRVRDASHHNRSIAIAHGLDSLQAVSNERATEYRAARDNEGGQE